MTCIEYLNKRRNLNKNETIFLTDNDIEMIINSYCYDTGDKLQDVNDIITYINTLS